jgi:hypothetical protein
MPALVDQRITMSTGPIFVLYRTTGGPARERFSRRRVGAALQRAEFIERVEGCRVYLQYGWNGPKVRAVS